MMMMQVKWQLMYLCIIAIAATVVVPGSSGFNEPLSLESSSPNPAFEAQVPNSVLERRALLSNGPTVQPPSIKSPPFHQTIQGPMPHLSPIKSTTLPPQTDLTASIPTQTPHDSAPSLSAEPPDHPDFPAASAPQDSTPPPVADLSHSLAPPLPTAEPPPSAKSETSNNSTMTPSAESPHASAVSPAANPPDYIPQLPTAEPPENLPIASYAPPPGVSLHNLTMQSPPSPPEAPVVIPQPPVAKPPHSIALPLAAKPPESNPPLPVAVPPQGLTLTPPTEAPPVFPVLPPPSDTPSSPAPQNASASPPKPVSPDAPTPTSVPSNASFLPPSMAPPSSDPPTTVPSPSFPLAPNAFSPPPQLIPPKMPSPLPQLNPPIVSSPPPQINPPTESSPPSQINPPVVSSPPPQLDPPIVSSPPPQSNTPMVSSPPPQLNPPMMPSPPPQLNPPMVSSPPPQSNPPTVSSPRPSLNPPIVSSPPPQLIPPIAISPLPQLNPPNSPIVSSPPPQMIPPMVSSPPPQLNPPMVSSPPPRVNPPMVSSPPPRVNPPMVSSPPPQISPPMVSSPPPQISPPMVSSPPPQVNPPMVSSPPPQLNPPMVSSPPPQANPPMVSSPPPLLNPPMVSSPPPKMIPPIVSSPPPQLMPPIASSPPSQLIPLPALPPNSAVPSNATVPPPLIASPPDSSSPPLAVPPHASTILSPPLPSHASPPLPQLAPLHGSPPPSEFPFVSPPHSSSVPQSVPPHPSPPLAPTSPATSSRPSYAPPPSKPSRLSVPPSPVMQQIAPAVPPLSSQRKEPPNGVSPPSLTSPEPSPASKTLPEAAPPAHPTTPRSQPPSSHQIEAPKHSPLMRSNISEPNSPPSSTLPPSSSPRYPFLAPPGRAPDQSPRNRLSPYHAPSKPKVERHQANAPAPFSVRVYPSNNGSHHSLRRSSAKGSPPAMSPLSSPPEKQEISSAPSPLPRAPPGLSGTPFPSPKISPSGSSSRNTKKPRAPPIRSLPPPPPNADCAYLTCAEPFTNTPPGSPCGCVWPMQVGLRLSVPLYTFFPLVTELSREIAAGVFMKQSQVRVMGANAASESEKTIALVNLVPLTEKFDNVTSDLTFQRFWDKQVVIDKSVFGDYDVLYVRYPGLPPSPPMAPADMAVVNGMPYSVRDPNQSNAHPLGVDVTKKKDKSKLSGIAIVAIVFSAIVGVLICCSVAWFLVFRHKTRDNQSAETPRVLPSLARSSAPTGNSTGSGPGSSMSVESSLATYAGSAKTFSTSEIEKATDNLNPSRIIGEGGFGLVYGGVLEDETNVAVKVLKREDQQGGREFLAEVEMLSRLHHRNLVKLIGICTDERLRCLVYELIPNGSVDSHLHGADKDIAPLDWPSRMKIALGAARGLAYLHEDSSPRVIHRDFKSSNILLENDFTPKVSDFGLARSAMDGESRHISTRVMGTFGYVAPEYAMTGHLLVKSDVYSYGVVLLELLTGRKPVDMSQPPGQENLVAWTRPFLTTKENLELIIDHSLGPDLPLDSVAKVAAIASMCVQPEVSHRPFMGEVVQALKLVCNECDDSKDGDSSPASPGNLSVDYEAKASPASETHDYIPTQYSPQKYFPTHDVEKGFSVSENFSSTAQVVRQASDSFRRHSASGPLKTVKARHFWQRIGRQSNGSVSEHGIMYRLWAGSH